MKIFRTKQPSPYGEDYTEILEDLKNTTIDLENTYVNLANVIDPDLIDYYIYHAKAMQIRHKFLLSQLKQLERHAEALLKPSAEAKTKAFLQGSVKDKAQPLLQSSAEDH